MLTTIFIFYFFKGRQKQTLYSAIEMKGLKITACNYQSIHFGNLQFFIFSETRTTLLLFLTEVVIHFAAALELFG